MCHGCVYTGSFVLDYHALYLQHFVSIESYRLKALITLEQVITSISGRKKEQS